MKIVHMADSHLGFSNHSRVDKYGRNLVEEMIYDGFNQVIDRIIELKPDAVVHAGDVFHHVRPRIRPLYAFKQGLEKLQDAGIPVVVISGNHDAPKSYSAISPFYIYEGMKGVNIAHRYKYERFDLGDRTVHCIPFCLDPGDYLKEFGKIDRSGNDVLVMHGLVEALSNKKMRTVGEHTLLDSLLKSDFDYIALGHYHGQAQISENAWYSGSIEYFNFGEAADKKGILFVDLEKREAKQIEVRPRYMIDLPPIDCSGISSSELAEVLFDHCDPEEIRDRIIRVNLKNVQRSAYRNLNHVRLNKLSSIALYFKIKVEYEDEKELVDASVDSMRLHEEFVKFLEDEASRGGISRGIKDEVTAYGSDLLKKAVASHVTEALDAPE
ncbi:MAG: exonuclease SbcCD subunit D [Methanotrichaceae archaeon]